MKYLTGFLLTGLLLTGSAAADEDPWRAGDQVARTEAQALRTLYDSGSAAFARADYVAAFRALDYAAWQGSVAAAMRLCVLDGYGIGTAPNPLKAAYWCARAHQAGHGLRQVERHLDAADYVAR